MQLSSYVKIIPLTTVAQGAAGTTTITGPIIDTQGFASGLFIVPVGTVTAGAVTSIRLEHGSVANLSDAAIVAYTGQTIADTQSNAVLYIDIRQFMRRYVRLIVSRATQNSSFGATTCLLYEAFTTPTVHAVGVTGEVHTSAGSGPA